MHSVAFHPAVFEHMCISCLSYSVLPALDKHDLVKHIDFSSVHVREHD